MFGRSTVYHWIDCYHQTWKQILFDKGIGDKAWKTTHQVCSNCQQILYMMAWVCLGYRATCYVSWRGACEIAWQQNYFKKRNSQTISSYPFTQHNVSMAHASFKIIQFTNMLRIWNMVISRVPFEGIAQSWGFPSHQCFDSINCHTVCACQGDIMHWICHTTHLVGLHHMVMSQ